MESINLVDVYLNNLKEIENPFFIGNYTVNLSDVDVVFINYVYRDWNLYFVRTRYYLSSNFFWTFGAYLRRSPCSYVESSYLPMKEIIKRAHAIMQVNLYSLESDIIYYLRESNVTILKKDSELSDLNLLCNSYVVTRAVDYKIENALPRLLALLKLQIDEFYKILRQYIEAATLEQVQNLDILYSYKGGQD